MDADKSTFVIGASAGGVETLESLVSQLPANFAGSVFIVLHLTPDYRSQLPEVLQRSSQLPVKRPQDGEEILPGHVYVAIPNHHLMLEKRHIRLTSGPKENRFRPSVDVLFRSAAWAHGSRVVGVILTGALDDGTPGLYAIKERGGFAIVQDPDQASCAGMPQSAIDHVPVDEVMRIEEIGALLVELSKRPMQAHDSYEVPFMMESEVGIARGDNGRMREIMELGKFSPYTCPECHGVLIRIAEERIVRYRCHTGHAFTLNHLMSELTQKNEDTIMSALRSLEETEALLEHAARDLDGENPAAAKLLLGKVEHVKGQAALVKKAAMANEVMTLQSLCGAQTES